MSLSQYYLNIKFSYNFLEQENLVSEWGGKGRGKKSSLKPLRLAIKICNNFIGIELLLSTLQVPQKNHKGLLLNLRLLLSPNIWQKH